MKIGIDIDDTICRTTEIVNEKMEEYAKKNDILVLDIINYDSIKAKFFEEYMPIIYSEAVVKRDVCDVVRRLRSKGNQIYIITGRSISKTPSIGNAANITEEWLRKNGIEVDGIFSSAYGESKADVCKREHIDLMIDDDPYNYKMITGNGGHCLLFDDREKYDLRKDYATSWLEVEEYINKFRG